jgi:hypothetical protein
MNNKFRHILVVDASTQTFWQKKGSGWIELPKNNTPPKEFLIVSNLQEEAVSTEALPSLLFHDRKALAERRLAFAYPDTEMRTWAWIGKPFWGEGYASFFTLVNNKRIEEIAQTYLEMGCRIGGIRTSTMLLWQFAAKYYKKQTCLVMLRLPHAIRLLAIANGRPILTRYLEIIDDEIINNELATTWRYLMNQRLVSPGTNPVVQWHGNGSESDISILLNTHSPLEIASVRMRIPWLTHRLSINSIKFSVLILISSLIYGLAGLVTIFESASELGRINFHLNEISNQIEPIEKKLNSSGVSINALRAAQRFFEAELNGQPYPIADLVAVSRAIALANPQIKLTKIDWIRSNNDKLGCAGTINQSTESPVDSKFSAVQRVLKLNFTPDTALSPRLLDASLEQLSSALKNINGAKIEINELDAQRSETFTSGSGNSVARQGALNVCMILGGVESEN